MAETYLDLKQVCKIYTGVQALKDVDFSLTRGEIHCLVGENGSGKSTLIKIISGVVKPEEGAQIKIEGEEIDLEHHHFSSKFALEKGIHVIYQDLSLFPNLTVAENISFNMHIEAENRFVRWKKMKDISKTVMDEIGINFDVDEIVGNLSIADQQLVAICRSLVGEIKLLIMDEPTSSLTKHEVDALFAVVKQLQQKGITTLFVSHKLDEIFQIAERVTVLRDGTKIGTFDPNDLDNDSLTFHMTGKNITYTKLSSKDFSKEKLLEVRNLSKKGNFKNINLTLHKGEILGITGLLGSGRTEFIQALFGMNPPEKGEIYLEGKKVRIGSTKDAIRLGIGYVPENRLTEGLVLQQSVGNNIIITILQNLLNNFGLVDKEKRAEKIDTWIKDLSIKVPTAEAPVNTLSGGNQQRVVLAKWLATSPKVLILDGPTIGVDVAAKSSIHDIVKKLASHGIGVIIISDEVHEVLYNCHTIKVMKKGRIIGEFPADETSEEEVSQKINVG